jgi:hypothetical protein
MIDDKLREQLSSLLDNQLPAGERKAVEQKIQSDPEVRAEWDALREFVGVLNQTAPAAVQAPPDFRAKILDRLKAPPSGGPGTSGPAGAMGGAAGLEFLAKITLPVYLAAGTVSAGLVGGMIYLDYCRSQKPAPKISQQTTDLITADNQASAKPMPEFRGPVNQQSEGMAAGDIQGHAVLDKTTLAEVAKAKGRVYSIGQGNAVHAGGVVTQPWGNKLPETRTELTLPETGGIERINFEGTGGWTAARVEQMQAGSGRTPVPAARVLNLAQKHHVNPGLLCAAAREFPGRSITGLALDLRASLNASAKLPDEDARLKKCLHDLGGPETSVAKWKKYLQGQ